MRRQNVRSHKRPKLRSHKNSSLPLVPESLGGYQPPALRPDLPLLRTARHVRHGAPRPAELESAHISQKNLSYQGPSRNSEKATLDSTLLNGCVSCFELRRPRQALGATAGLTIVFSLSMSSTLGLRGQGLVGVCEQDVGHIVFACRSPQVLKPVITPKPHTTPWAPEC